MSQKPRFSDRIGVTKQDETFQLDDMSVALRNALWNWFISLFDDQNDWRRGAHDLLPNYWKERADEVDAFPGAHDKIKKHFFEMPWYEVYNLIEYPLENRRWVRWRDGTSMNPLPETQLNYLLERERSGYRAINGVLVPITTEEEISSITEAQTPKRGLEGVAQHIRTAAELMSRRPQPDYRNSIKESISAVEAVAKILAGEKSGGIDSALGILERRTVLHPAFKSALAKLYGYTSDKDGIRHPILEEQNIGFAEAKFMLVACSAFANFLIDSARDSLNVMV